MRSKCRNREGVRYTACFFGGVAWTHSAHTGHSPNSRSIFALLESCYSPPAPIFRNSNDENAMPRVVLTTFTASEADTKILTVAMTPKCPPNHKYEPQRAGVRQFTISSLMSTGRAQLPFLRVTNRVPSFGYRRNFGKNRYVATDANERVVTLIRCHLMLLGRQ